ELLPRGYAHAVDIRLDGDAELLECVSDRNEVGLLDAVDRDVAARDRGETDEAAHLDVVWADLPLAAAERLDALDAQDVGLDPLDPRTERAEKTAEILDVRLASRVADDGLAGRERRDHDGVLGRHHARLVQEDGLPAQPAPAHLVAATDVDLCAELGEGVDVRVEPPTADHI